MTVRRMLAVLLAAAALAAPASAGPLVDSLKKRQAEIDAILARNPKELPAPERKALEQALATAFDFEAMGRSALAAEWEKRSPPERSAYVSAFERLIRASLVRQPDIYRALKVDYVLEKADTTTGRVETVVRGKETTTEVAYDFVKASSGWRISDYAVDGVSTARNYRSQFARILQKDGWAGLLDRIGKRAAAIEAGEAKR